MTYSVDWFSQFIPQWNVILKDLKGKPNLHFLEIGCFEGKATVWLLENILTGKNSHIDTIDMFGGGMEDGDKGAFFTSSAFKNYEENIKPFDIMKVVTHQGKSQEILRLMGNKPIFDFVYIDGSHRSPEVLEDSVLSWRLLKSGGILIWDDYGLQRYKNPLDNPKPAIDSFLSIYKKQYKLIQSKYQVAIRKI